MLRDLFDSHGRVAFAIAVVAAIGAAPLAACGIKGPLKPPPAPAPAATSQPAEPAATPAPQPREGEP